MSMIEPEGRTIGPEPVAAPEAPPEIPAPEADVAVKVDSQPEEVETFDRKYVEQLRDEAARYRTRSRDYEAVFGEMPEDIRAGWMELINTANAGDPEAMNSLGQMLGFIEDTPETPPAEEPQYLTAEQARDIARREAEQVWSQEREERAQADAIATVETDAKAMGYDTKSPDYVQLLWFANNIDADTLGSNESILQAADRQMKDYQRQQYAAFIEGKEAEARTSPQVAEGNGVAPNLPVAAPKTFEEARERLHERLSNIQR